VLLEILDGSFAAVLQLAAAILTSGAWDLQ